MIFGGVEREQLQLNEATLWAGGPYDPDNTNALAALPEVRQLIFAGQYDDAGRADQRQNDGRAAAPNALSDPGRSVSGLCNECAGGKLPPRSGPRHRRGQRQLHGERRAFQARNIFQPGGPGHRDPSDRRQAGADFLHRRHDHAAKGQTTVEVNRMPRSADQRCDAGAERRQRRRARHQGRAEISGAGARAGGSGRHRWPMPTKSPSPTRMPSRC